jgi:hypothetical protein
MGLVTSWQRGWQVQVPMGSMLCRQLMCHSSSRVQMAVGMSGIQMDTK